MNQTLTENAPSIRLQADMLEEFWTETVSHACYLIYIGPHLQSLIFRSQRRYGEESLWTI